MKRYSEYKDSGVEWIGEVPSHWDVLPMRHLLQLIQTGSTPSTSIDEFFDGDIKWFTPGDFCDDKYLSNCNRCLTRLAIDKNEAKLLPKDTVLLVGIGATLGKVAMLSEESSFNQQITGLVTNKKIIPKFLYYWLKMNTNTLLKTSNFTTLPIVNNEFIKSFPTICPSIEEQEKIVKYLDKKTTQIETLIIKKEELIETLKASGNKLISETVTKGLDKDVSMKDSGLEWIGEIPSHWKLNKLKREFEFSVGGTPSSGNMEYYTTNEDEGYKWVNISDLNNKVISDTKSYVTIEGIKNTSMKLVTEGSLLFSFKLSVGQVAFIDKPMYTNEAIASFSPENNINNLKYLYYAAPIYIVENANENIYGAKILNQELIKNAFIVLPPIEEQEKISNYLDKKTSQIDTLVETIEEQIDVLKKAKNKLITEVVTGKIDVTNL